LTPSAFQTCLAASLCCTGNGSWFFPLPHFEPSANQPMNLFAPKPV
jgi:hypothetical protein